MRACQVASIMSLWDPMDCSPPSSSVHGILQAKNTGVGSPGIFLTQGSNLHLLHYRQFLDRWATGEAPYVFITQYNFAVWKSKTSNQGDRNLANKKKWNQHWSWYLHIFKLCISDLLLISSTMFFLLSSSHTLGTFPSLGLCIYVPSV